MKVDPRFNSVLSVMMDIPDADVLFQNPEDALQLPSIAYDVSQGDLLHVEVGAEAGECLAENKNEPGEQKQLPIEHECGFHG